MKKLWLWVVCAVAMAGAQGAAQDVTGTWQGTLVTPQRGLRLVLKITKDDGVLKSAFYSIDQGGQSIPVGKTTLAGSELKITIPAIGGGYEGKVSSDGSAITGTFTQGEPLPLNLARATPATEWAIPEPPPKLKPMAKDANPSFEVATIKPSKPDSPGPGFGLQGRRFSTRGTTVADLVSFAYVVHAKQLLGGPDWLLTERFDISAQPDAEGEANLEQWKTMIKKLLADRFQLKFHEEKRELPAYVLTVGKNGPKMTAGEGDENTIGGVGFSGPGKFRANNATMANVCEAFQAVALDRPVIDKTELKGRWTFALNWSPDDSQFRGLGIKFQPPAEGVEAPPPLFTAIQDQIGLRLEPVKTQVGVMVVDKAEKPSEN